MIKNIILDYGHGGIDKNGRYTTAPSKMFTHANGETAFEGVLNRQIGGHLYWFFHTQRPDIRVINTVNPHDSRDIALAQRVRVANRYNPSESIFISIHSNASASHRARGFEIYTSVGNTRSDKLATSIGRSVKEYYDRVDLKLRFDFSDIDSPDLDKEEDFYVLQKTRCPAVLLECLFFDNKQDFKALKNPEFQKELAWHVFKGVMRFVR